MRPCRLYDAPDAKRHFDMQGANYRGMKLRPVPAFGARPGVSLRYATSIYLRPDDGQKSKSAFVSRSGSWLSSRSSRILRVLGGSCFLSRPVRTPLSRPNSVDTPDHHRTVAPLYFRCSV